MRSTRFLNHSLTLGLIAVTATLAVGDAWAGDIWLCSITSAVAVDEDGTVGPPDLGDKERPTFFRLDAAKKELTLLAPESRRGEVTKLEAVHQSEGVSVFSGRRRRGVVGFWQRFTRSGSEVGSSVLLPKKGDRACPAAGPVADRCCGAGAAACPQARCGCAAWRAS